MTTWERSTLTYLRSARVWKELTPLTQETVMRLEAQGLCQTDKSRIGLHIVQITPKGEEALTVGPQ